MANCAGAPTHVITGLDPVISLPALDEMAGSSPAMMGGESEAGSEAFAGMTIERGTRQFLFVTLTKVRVQLCVVKLYSGVRRNDDGRKVEWR